MATCSATPAWHIDMAQQSVTVTAAGTSAPIYINQQTFAYGVGLLCTVTGAIGGSYTVQVTGDPANSLTHWNSHDTLSGQSVSANGNLAYPVTAVRLNGASVTGAGSVTMSVVQIDTVPW